MQSSTVLAGGEPGDFARVRHVALRGSQREIGSDIAALAWANHGVRPLPSSDRTLTRARRRWRERHWPELEERASGVADHWGLSPDDDRHELASLPLGLPRTGCSVVWLPRNRTTTGTSLLTRNFDFPALSLNQMIGAPPQEDDEGFCAQPYVLETHPGTGHATLTITAFDLLMAAVDGINDAGVVAVLLSDDDSTTGGANRSVTEPTFAPAVGLSEVEFCRFVLERCSDVDEALEAVRVARHYYFVHPQHFLVADRSGRSFVYEFSPGRNDEHVIWGDGAQIVTNHLLYRYPTSDDLPTGDGVAGTYSRFRRLSSSFSDQDRYGRDEIAERHSAVRFTRHDLSVRTLWHAVYDVDAGTMDASFYLRDVGDTEVRTPTLHFDLQPAALR
jgi:hypothetical protein